jgi:HAMP domain-containing protein
MRITVAATATVAVGLLILGFALLSVLRSSLLESQAGSGPRRAAELAALAAKAPLPNPLPAIDADPPTFVQLLDPDGAVIGASEPLAGAAALLDPSARGRHVLHDVPGLAPGSWLAEPSPATIGGRSLTLIVLTSLGGYDRGVRLLRNVLLVTVPVLIAFVGVLVWTVIGRTLRTVEAMRLQVDRITSERLDRRVVQPPVADEIGRLARTLNHMLDRLQASSDGQRRFIADASHELRTPIANIRTACEVAGAHPERADWPSVADDVLEQTARMERLTGELLDLAPDGGR